MSSKLRCCNAENRLNRCQLKRGRIRRLVVTLVFPDPISQIRNARPIQRCPLRSRHIRGEELLDLSLRIFSRSIRLVSMFRTSVSDICTSMEEVRGQMKAQFNGRIRFLIKDTQQRPSTRHQEIPPPSPFPPPAIIVS